MQFVDDTYFDETMQTPHGPVRVMAETHIFGTHLVLDELLFYPLDQKGALRIGVARVLAIRQSIHVAARAAGFTVITEAHHRLGKKRPGNTMVFTRKLV